LQNAETEKQRRGKERKKYGRREYLCLIEPRNQKKKKKKKKKKFNKSAGN